MHKNSAIPHFSHAYPVSELGISIHNLIGDRDGCKGKMLFHDHPSLHFLTITLEHIRTGKEASQTRRVLIQISKRLYLLAVSLI